MKWNPVMKVWKKSELMLMRYEGKSLDFGASIGLLPLYFDRLMKWNPMYEGIERNWPVDVDEILRKMLGFRACVGCYPLFGLSHEMKLWLWRFERNRSWCWWEVKKNCLGFSVCLWLYIWTVSAFWIHYYFCLTVPCCVSRVGVVGVGGIWIHLLLLLHIYTLPIICTSLTSFKTMFNIVYAIGFFQDHYL